MAMFRTVVLLLTVTTFTGQGFASDSPKPRLFTDDILDLVLPPMKITVDNLYVERLMLRFSQPMMEIIVVVKSGGAIEATCYRVESFAAAADLIKKANSGDGTITATQIAKTIHINQKNLKVTREQLRRWFDELRSMHLSPLLQDTVCLDSCPKFDFWYDTRQDSVRYSVYYAAVSPPIHSQQEMIAEWMLRVRDEIGASSTSEKTPTP